MIILLLSLLCPPPSQKPVQLLAYPSSSSATSTGSFICCNLNYSLPWPQVRWANSFALGSCTSVYPLTSFTVLEESAKPKAYRWNSSRLNNSSLTPFFSPTLNSLMEISWHYPKAFTSWAELSRQKPKTATPQEFEQRKGF